ncbi:MAG: ABC transporter substrate-binding protein [Aeromicrobium sp.]
MTLFGSPKRKASALGLAAALALSACGGGSGGDTSDGGGGDKGTFNFVAALPMSGPLSAIGGQPYKTAFETTVEIINKDGGIDGKKVKLTIIDTAGDATKAVANVQAYLADNDKPDAMFSGYSFEALPLAPLLTKQKIPLVSSSVTPLLNNPDKFPYTFQQSVPIRTIIDVLSDHIVEKGHKKVGYIAVDDESGHVSVDAFKKVASAKGLTVTGAFVKADAVDATSTLEKLKASKPDVVVVSAVGPAAAAILKSRTEIGWDVPTIGEGSAFAASDLGKISSKEYWGNVEVQMPNWTVKGSDMLSVPAFDTYLKDYKAKSAITTGMGGLVCLYQDLLTIKAGFEATDQDDAEGFAKGLEGIGADTIPDSIKDLWVGPKGLGYGPDNHDNAEWGADDFTFVPAQALVDGMATADGS